MALIDDFIFKLLASSGGKKLTLEEIAREAKCHPNTARNSTLRLASSGRIVRDPRRRGGTYYKVVNADN